MDTLSLFDMPKYTITPEAAAIYEEYPRKIAKPAACTAIIRAVKKHGFDHVLEKTRQFARKVRDSAEDLKFIPYPATFFNQERYNDDFDAMFPAHVGRPLSLQQRRHACDQLIAENDKALEKLRLPDVSRYQNGADNPKYKKELQETISRRTELKNEQCRLKAQLKDILKQML